MKQFANAKLSIDFRNDIASYIGRRTKGKRTRINFQVWKHIEKIGFSNTVSDMHVIFSKCINK